MELFLLGLALILWMISFFMNFKMLALICTIYGTINHSIIDWYPVLISQMVLLSNWCLYFGRDVDWILYNVVGIDLWICISAMDLHSCINVSALDLRIKIWSSMLFLIEFFKEATDYPCWLLLLFKLIQIFFLLIIQRFVRLCCP